VKISHELNRAWENSHCTGPTSDIFCVFPSCPTLLLYFYHTMISDAIQQQLEKIGKDTYLADRELAIQRNKLMKPIYSKRRDILKQVPNFWGTAVSSLSICMSQPPDCQA
jgi:hypothetical protein